MYLGPVVNHKFSVLKPLLTESGNEVRLALACLITPPSLSFRHIYTYNTYIIYTYNKMVSVSEAFTNPENL